MNKKGFTLVELIGVIAILAVISLICSVTYLNVRDSLLEKQYENVVDYIENAAEDYAKDTSTTITNVQELIDLGYITADDDKGYIYNPKSNTKLNCYVINIEYEDGEYTATLSDTELCELESETKGIKFIKNGICDVSNDTWYKDDVILAVSLSNNCSKLTGYEFSWTSTTGAYSTLDEYTVKRVEGQLVTASYNVDIKKIENNVTTTAKGTTKVQIDGIYPVLNKVEKEELDDYFSVTLTVSDEGSGIMGAYLVESSECSSTSCCSTNSSSYNKVTNGKYVDNNVGNSSSESTYYACIMDNVGNITDGKVQGGLYEIKVPQVDKIVDEVTLTYEPYNTWTNSDVTLTGEAKDEQHNITGYIFSQSSITPKADSSDWTNIKESKQSKTTTQTKSVSTNGTYYFHAKDEKGNTRYASVEVNNIDKVKPDVQIKVSTTNLTSELTLTGTATDSASGIVAYAFVKDSTSPKASDWQKVSSSTTKGETSITKYKTISGYSNNGLWYFCAKDLAGNYSCSKAGTATNLFNRATMTFELSSLNNKVNSTASSEAESSKRALGTVKSIVSSSFTDNRGSKSVTFSGSTITVEVSGGSYTTDTKNDIASDYPATYYCDSWSCSKYSNSHSTAYLTSNNMCTASDYDLPGDEYDYECVCNRNGVYNQCKAVDEAPYTDNCDYPYYARTSTSYGTCYETSGTIWYEREGYSCSRTYSGRKYCMYTCSWKSNRPAECSDSNPYICDDRDNDGKTDSQSGQTCIYYPKYTVWNYNYTVEVEYLYKT